MKPYKLAVITTHPIQYYAPWFRYIADKGDIDLKVFYTWGESSINKYEADFGAHIKWDIDLLNGYKYTFCTNKAIYPGTSSFWGIQTTDLKAKIKEFDPDEICIYGWAWWSHFWFIISYRGKALLSFRGDSHLLDAPKGILKPYLKKIFLQWLFSKINTFYSVGIANEAYYKFYAVKMNKIIRVPHAIDNKRFSMATINKDEIRTTLGIKDDEMVMLFVGKLIPKKAPLELIESLVLSGRKDVHLYIIGSGILSQIVLDKVKKYNNIHFLGFINQKMLPNYYAAADVLCLPSIGPQETWGLVANEAMAAGIPVIVSDKCGCAYDLVTEETGWVFNTFNDLIHILKNLDIETCAMKGERAQAFVYDVFSFKSNYLKLKNYLFQNT